jgi:cytochrome c oxidase subunit IV
MSTGTGTHIEPTEDRGAAGPQEVGHEAHQHAHPSDRKYVIIAIILAIITAAEVSTYFMEDPSTGLLVAMLFPMMIAKFVIVCGWFMHLRYDNPLFRRVFVFGLVLAVAVYLVALSAMEFWTDGSGAAG